MTTFIFILALASAAGFIAWANHEPNGPVPFSHSWLLSVFSNQINEEASLDSGNRKYQRALLPKENGIQPPDINTASDEEICRYLAASGVGFVACESERNSRSYSQEEDFGWQQSTQSEPEMYYISLDGSSAVQDKWPDWD